MQQRTPDQTALSSELRALQLYKIELEMQNEELRAAQAELQQERARFRDLYDNAPVPYVTLEADGSIVDANVAASDLLKRPRVNLLGRRLGLYIVEDDRAAFQNLLDEQFRSGVAVPCELRVGGDDEPIRTVLVSSAPLADRSLTRVTLTDVSWRREADDGVRFLEVSLHDAQRMDAIARLAGGIAHDFNNLLTVVGANSDLLELELSPNDSRREFVEQIAHAAGRAAVVTRKLLAFSRKQVLVVKQVDVNHVVINVVRLLSRKVGAKIKLRTNLSSSPAIVEIDEQQFEQALLNIAMNARDAMPSGGQLRFSTAIETFTESVHDSTGTILPGTYVKLIVRDSGVGIDPHIMHRIFEPFFTTKALGLGSGLGLSMAYGVVVQSGGHIAVTSTPGIGTAFYIRLPLCATESSTSTPQRAPAGSETILLIEDELASIVGESQHTLTALGYTVIPVGSEEAALQAVAEQGAHIDLIVIMEQPGALDRATLKSRVHARRPWLPLLTIPAPSPVAGAPARNLDAAELARAVRERLDASRSG